MCIPNANDDSTLALVRVMTSVKVVLGRVLLGVVHTTKAIMIARVKRTSPRGGRGFFILHFLSLVLRVVTLVLMSV